LSRLQSALHVYVFAALGIFLIVVPWSAAWDNATAPLLSTWIGSIPRSGFVRGLVSGLGGLNLVAAWGEARTVLQSTSVGRR
jgi:hypothetical protein